jgi:hypothetical protein
MVPDYEQHRLFPPLPDEVRMTRQELAHLLAREGIDSSALTRFCLVFLVGLAQLGPRKQPSGMTNNSHTEHPVRGQ